MKANQSLERAFAILEYLADNPGARLKDVSAACELAAPTASRFLSNLSELGYIQQQNQGFLLRRAWPRCRVVPMPLIHRQIFKRIYEFWRTLVN